MRSSATPSPRCSATYHPGQWFAGQLAEKIDAEKVMVRVKSGYFSRSSRATDDLRLIVDDRPTVECAIKGESGVIGQHEEDNDVCYPCSRASRVAALSTSLGLRGSSR